MAVFVVDPEPTPDAALQEGISTRLSPSRIYRLEIDQIINGPPPSEDQFVGWRYRASVAPSLAIEAAVDKKGKFLTLTAGPQIAKALRIAQGLGKFPNLPDEKYEVRLLTIGSLPTESFWLKSLSGGRDWVVPYNTAVKEIEENHLYWMDQFLGIVRPLAEKRRAAKEGPEFPTKESKQEPPHKGPSPTRK